MCVFSVGVYFTFNAQVFNYTSQQLKWIETIYQSCPKTKTIPVLVLVQL